MNELKVLADPIRIDGSMISSDVVTRDDLFRDDVVAVFQRWQRDIDELPPEFEGVDEADEEAVSEASADYFLRLLRELRAESLNQRLVPVRSLRKIRAWAPYLSYYGKEHVMGVFRQFWVYRVPPKLLREDAPRNVMVMPCRDQGDHR